MSGNVYRLVGWTGQPEWRSGDGVRDGVLSENDIGMKVKDFFAKKNLCSKHFLTTQEHPQVHIGWPEERVWT